MIYHYSPDLNAFETTNQPSKGRDTRKEQTELGGKKAERSEATTPHQKGHHNDDMSIHSGSEPWVYAGRHISNYLESICCLTSSMVKLVTSGHFEEWQAPLANMRISDHIHIFRR